MLKFVSAYQITHAVNSLIILLIAKCLGLHSLEIYKNMELNLKDKFATCKYNHLLIYIALSAPIVLFIHHL